MVAISMTQFCHFSARATTDNIQSNGCRCVPIKYYFRKEVEGQIWSMGSLKKIIYVQCRLDVPLGCLQFYFILFTEIELTNM